VTKFRLAIELTVALGLLIACCGGLWSGLAGGSATDIWHTFAGGLAGSYVGLILALVINDRGGG